ncbi:MAG: type I polyketide synthase, partial [Acidobacteriota bacterium]|nr:type I polyketide synthase [Acidobacteriota bacterium]
MADAQVPASLARRLLEEVRVRREESARNRSPIAIVGMACRFPGGENPATFWRQLAAGADAVTRGRPGETAVEPPWGSYVPDLDRFDAEFFRVAPVEAELLDPQQRLLLEVSWEALEDAGLDPARLAGSSTGVFAGIMSNDYAGLIPFPEGDPSRGFHYVTGNSSSTAIGRVAFTLGLEGPAVAVDTACSSSLVAMHQAAVALQRSEVDLALCGGVNAMLLPRVTRLLQEAGMIAPDGRCKTFDAAANGFGRGEGCGMLVMKRLADAEASGDRILGVLLGSAVNHDGASAGLTVPSGGAQERVIAEALDRAGVEPAAVDYLEAHGTGTELGDPIELRAAAAAYGPERPPDRPLLVGSVKTNVGHLESAAGVASVIKVLLALRAGSIPPHLHLERPNPRVDWDRLPLKVTREATAWPRVSGQPRRAAVSSFSFSGTNAHVVIEGPPPDREAPGALVAAPAVFPAETGESGARPDPVRAPLATRSRRVLPLSGKSAKALTDLAGRYLDWLGEREADLSPEELADAAWVAGAGRSHFSWRAAIPFRDHLSLRERLAAVAASSPAPPGSPARTAFLFTGQGSQWKGMGRELHDTEPVFREVLERCDAAFREERGGSLLPVMFGEAEGLDQTEWTQPALYALSCSLTALWASVGIRPDVVFGHSVGEIAAAQAAGVFGLEAGMRFAARRGALMGRLPVGGAMTAVFAATDHVERLISEEEGPRLDIAAENGAHQVVSGAVERVAAFETRCASEGLRIERLRTSHAFHSALMDPALDEIAAAARDLAPQAPSVPLVSNVSGRPARAAERLDGAYWRLQARAPVAFGAGVRSLAELEVGVLVEVGPRAVLGPLASLGWAQEQPPAVVASLGGETGFVDAVAEAYEAGLQVSFEGLFAGERRRRISLPTYPFQRKRHWAPTVAQRPDEGVGRTIAVEDLLYEVVWRDAPPGAGSDAGGHFVVCGGEGAIAGELAEELSARKQRVTLAGGPGWGGAEESRARWREFFESLGNEELAGVVFVEAASGETAAGLGADLRRIGEGALGLAQGLMDAGLSSRSGLWLVTRGGQVLEEQVSGALAGAVLWGFGRTLAVELGGVPVRLVDLDPGSGSGAEELASELLHRDRETEVAWRGGRRQTPRLVRFRPSSQRRTEQPVREERTYLLTGGTGGMGRSVAEWLLTEGAGAVVLNGRREPRGTVETEIARLREQAGERGAEVRVELGDVSDPAAVRDLVGRSGPAAGLPPLGGVFHCVGGLSDAALQNQDWAGFERVLGPKVLGAWELHRATEELDLDLFVLFSSVAGVFGNAGQANYAAANAFLDQLALYRRGQGLPGQAIQWGPWSGAGLAEAARDRIAGRLSATGAGWLTAEEGLRALGRLLRENVGSAVAVAMDWERAGEAGAPPALLSELVTRRAPEAEGELMARLGSAPRGRREEVVRRFVREEVLSVLRLDAPPSEEVGFFDLGMDSVTAVELRGR